MHTQTTPMTGDKGEVLEMESIGEIIDRQSSAMVD